MGPDAGVRRCAFGLWEISRIFSFGHLRADQYEQHALETGGETDQDERRANSPGQSRLKSDTAVEAKNGSARGDHSGSEADAKKLR